MPQVKQRARAISRTPADLQAPAAPHPQENTRRKSSHMEYREFLLRSGRIQFLKFHSHDLMKLVKDAVSSFHHRSWTAQQTEVLQEWYAWYQAWYNYEASEVPDGDQMVYAVKLLGRIFFLDSLDEKLIQFSWDALLMRQKGSYGETVDHGTLPLQLTIDPQDFHREQKVRDHRSSLVGTLLHECCHAFLTLHACQGECGDMSCHIGNYSSIGESGHAGAWLYLASHVEIAARNHLKWADIRLGIFTDLIAESHASMYAPARKDWEALLGNLSEDGRWQLMSAITDREWAGIEVMYRCDEALASDLKQELVRMSRERKKRTSKRFGAANHGQYDGGREACRGALGAHRSG